MAAAPQGPSDRTLGGHLCNRTGETALRESLAPRNARDRPRPFPGPFRVPASASLRQPTRMRPLPCDHRAGRDRRRSPTHRERLVDHSSPAASLAGPSFCRARNLDRRVAERTKTPPRPPLTRTCRRPPLRGARARQAARAARRPPAGAVGDAQEPAEPEGTARERRLERLDIPFSNAARLRAAASRNSGFGIHPSGEKRDEATERICGAARLPLSTRSGSAAWAGGLAIRREAVE